MTPHADIFVDIKAHIASGRFIRDNSSNTHDIRDFTFDSADLGNCRDLLDLGCAYGFFTRGLAGRVHPDANVVGLDLWEGCEDHFVKACRESGFTGEFYLSDEIFCKRFPDDSFDFVLCSYTLYFFPEAIPDIARVLRPGGLFITVTHTVPHMQELVDLIKKLLGKHLGRPVRTLPLEKLFDAFSDVNGHQMLSPWFHKIMEKEYSNTLQVNTAALPNLINYLCFKRPKFIPRDLELDDQFIREDVADYLHDLLTRQEFFTISKNDTVFICQHPRKK